MRSPAELITDDVAVALACLHAGGLVGIPTETVYGLAADAENPAAVARIFEAKGRPTNHPLIVHISDVSAISGWVDNMSRDAMTLAEACWPGPLTMLLPRGPRVHDSITGGRESVGIRVQSHPLTRDLLDRFGGGLAAPSANRFGRVSPTRATHVVADLGTVLNPSTDVILDGGPCPIGVESTIVDLMGSSPQVLRAGAISADEISRLLDIDVESASGTSRAPGMMLSHYAPLCAIELVKDQAAAEVAIGRLIGAGHRARALDRTSDLVVAARELYGDLRQADIDELDTLVIVMPAAIGIGHALRDRLQKASNARQ